jgi:hypothetical protein
LPVLLGMQLILAFLACDIAAAPVRAIHTALRGRTRAVRSARLQPRRADALLPEQASR